MSRITRLLIGLLSVVLLAVACGVPIDDSPTEFEASALIPELRPGQLPTAAPRAADFNFQIFMVGENDRLTTVPRRITLDGNASTAPEIAANANAILAELLLGTTRDEKAVGVTTAISRETEVESITVDLETRIATVTLTPGSLARVVADEQRIAFGQIVYSLTARGTISGLVFAIADDPVPVQTDTATTEAGQPVSRSDFASLDPSAVIRFDAEDDDDDTLRPGPTPGAADSASADTAVDDADLIEAEVWMVNDQGLLEPVIRQVERSPEALIESLFESVSAEEEVLGIRSAVLPGSFTLDVNENSETTRFGTAFVDLSDTALPGLENNERYLAAGQIVFTLTGLVEIGQVVILIDGTVIPVPTQYGLSRSFDVVEVLAGDSVALQRSDYAPLAPEGTPLSPVGVVEDAPPTPAPAEDTTAAAPTAVPEPTATPSPTAVPVPTATPTVTPVPEPTATPFPTPGDG